MICAFLCRTVIITREGTARHASCAALIQVPCPCARLAAGCGVLVDQIYESKLSCETCWVSNWNFKGKFIGMKNA
jgi:hypothetical protein